MHKFLLYFIVLLLSFNRCLRAQNYSFDHYQTKDGLPNNSVFCIAQDKMGFMWFGTGDSLSRFDGADFKNYYPDTKGKPSIDYIGYLTTDKNGNVWVGMHTTGIFRYDVQSDALIPFLDSIKNINSLFFDKNNTLWIGVKERLYSYSFKQNKLTRYIPENKFKITCIAESGNGIWAGTDNGILYDLNPLSGKHHSYDIFQQSPETVLKTITKLLPMQDCCLMIGTASQGLKKFNVGKSSCENILEHSEDSDFIYVRDILQTSKYEFWIASETGVYIYNDSSKVAYHISKKVNNPYFLSDNSCYSVFKDNENGIWIGTYFSGLNYYNVLGNSRFTKYVPDNSPNNISGLAVRNICRDSFNNIWIGTEDAGLNKLDISTGKITQIKISSGEKHNGISYRNIAGLAAVRDKIWVGTYQHGIDVLDIKTDAVIKHYDSKTTKGSLGNDWATSILYTKSGSVFAGTQIGLYKYIPAKDGFQRIYLDNDKKDHFINCLLEGTHNNLWIGTADAGLYSLNLENINLPCNRYQNLTSVAEDKNYICSLFDNGKDTLWIGSASNGIYFLTPEINSLTPLNNEGSLQGDFVMNVQEDNYNNLWIATVKGIVKLNADRKTFVKYTMNDGLPTNECNFQSAYKDEYGNLYFGTTNGMVKFNPKDFHDIDFEPPLYITELNIANKKINPTDNPDILKRSIEIADTVILNYKQSSFNIGFSALNYSAPLGTKYEYILEGLEEKWTVLDSKRNAYFTNLSPGVYTFRVKATAKGFLPSKERRLTILIKPPLWRTNAAYLFYVIITALLIYFLIRYYKTRAQLKKDKELYEAKMSFFTNIAHEIKTPLSLIKGPLENISEHLDAYPHIADDVEMMDKHSERLITLVSQLLDFRQTESNAFRLNYSDINLSEVIKEMYHYFKSLKQFKNRDFKLSLPSDDKIIHTDKEALEKILSNLISNALKFSQSYVEVKLSENTITKKYLQLCIKNDGVLILENAKEKIFQPFVRLQETSSVAGTGIGLALCKNLAELLGYDLYVSEPENGMNAFVLIIPL